MTETIYIQIGDKKRKATPAELEQFEKDRIEAEAEASRIEAAELERQKAKESGMKKLKSLGLTDSEIAVLLGN